MAIPPLRTWLLSWLLVCSVVPSLAGEDRVVDFRYGLPTWHQPLGVPEDWHKPLASERGAWLYDFGPGPYVRALTTIEWSATGEPFTVAEQDYEETPRIPIMRTRLIRRGETVQVTTFSVAPESPAESNARFDGYERLDGISGLPDWARPGPEFGPEFRNVAWGITRPIAYRLRVEPGASKRIMLGFCESYKVHLFQRTASMHVEGAPAQTVDLALNAPHHQPQVFLFDARDTDADGWTSLRVFAPQGQDPNATLATIAMYPAGTTLSRAELVAGSLAQPDRAELRIACGTEMQHQPARIDVLHATFPETVEPVLEVRTGRRLSLGENGQVNAGEAPFLVLQPQTGRFETTEQGYRLVWPQGTREATAWILSGRVDAQTVAHARTLTVGTARQRTRERWSRYVIPFDRVQVADARIQRLIDASLRTLYQGREVIAGQTQFNSSFTLYRGLWAGDAVYFTTLAAHLGDSAAARQTFDALFSHQLPDGIVDELHPQQIYRTTAEVIWAVVREAEISNDWSYARQRWPDIVRGVEGIRSLREQTLRDPEAPFHGLFPPGFSDGGILDIGSEYSSVYCTITGLRAAERLARKLEKPEEAKAIAAVADGFLQSFNRHRQRDQRRDPNGNLYLPVRVGFKGPDPIPQLTQWAFMDAHLNGEGWLPSDHELVQGSLALLESVERQGLPVSMGWMPGGNWAGMGLFYGLQHLLLQRPDKVADVLYAAANHASRVGTFVEEQSLVGEPLKLAGDQPHNFASAMMVQLPAAMLAYDRLNVLHLLGALPAEWLKPGAVNRLDGYRTSVGNVTLAVTVDPSGRSAQVEVNPIAPHRRDGKILLHTASLRQAGFDVGSGEAVITLRPGERFSRRFERRSR